MAPCLWDAYVYGMSSIHNTDCTCDYMSDTNCMYDTHKDSRGGGGGGTLFVG